MSGSDPAVGTALLAEARRALSGRTEGFLCANGFTKNPEGMRFLEGQGFRETWRETPVVLELSRARVERADEVEAALSREGVSIRSYAELAGDRGRDRALHTLYSALDALVPSERDFVCQPEDFGDWLASHVDDPELLHDACLVALKGGRCIGLKEVGRAAGSSGISCGLMGVLPEFRRRGIAYAMQARTIRYSREAGCAALKSCTATVNLPMQRLYGELGYERLYEWAQYMRGLQSGPEPAAN